MNVDEILDRLHGGDTIDALADELSKMLNEANAKFQEEQNSKNQRLREIVSSLNAYVRYYYGNFGMKEDFFTEDMLEELFDAVKDIGVFLKTLVPEVKKSKVEDNKVAADDFEAVVADFLKHMK